MKVEEFEDNIKDMIHNFKLNMNSLSHNEENTEEKWMDMFLRWCEWKTDMHDAYWKEGEEYTEEDISSLKAMGILKKD